MMTPDRQIYWAIESQLEEGNFSCFCWSERDGLLEISQCWYTASGLMQPAG